MADRYHTPGGWTVEVVRLGDPCDRAVERLRIRHHGFWITDVASRAALPRWIPADELKLLERDTLIPVACGLTAALPRRRRGGACVALPSSS